MAPAPKPAVTRLGLLAYVLAAAVAIVDQLSKAWVLDGLHLADRPAGPEYAKSTTWNE